MAHLAEIEVTVAARRCRTQRLGAPAMTVSRRVILAAGVAAIGAVAAACSQTARPPKPAGSAAPSLPGSATTSAIPPAPAASPSVGSSKQSVVSSAPARTAVAPGGPAVEVVHGPRTRKEVALTFHGAGDVAIARELLAIFAAHRAAVTVMAVGTWLSDTPQIGREIVAAAHELGNHTYTHPDLDSLGSADIRTEIVRCRDLLASVVGFGGAHFRQSQAQHSTPLVRQLAGAAGYRTVLSYDVDSLDYTDPGPDAVRRAVAAAEPGSIVSMHFGHSDTVTAMPLILSDLASRGLTAVTATTLLRA